MIYHPYPPSFHEMIFILVYIDAGGDVFFVGVNVDDIVLAGRTLERITKVEETLSYKFDIKDTLLSGDASSAKPENWRSTA